MAKAEEIAYKAMRKDEKDYQKAAEKYEKHARKHYYH